jgi:predicted GH43/DUF377 family glycosyl hydrolase
MRRLVLAVAALGLAGCARYADFTLPAERGGDPTLTYRLEEAAAPVLSPGTGWESQDVLNPSVAGNLMLYSSWDGKTWRTGLATSIEAPYWQKQGMVLEPDPRTWGGAYIAANGALLRHAGQFWYWYHSGPRERPAIGLARSDDARHWRKQPAPVLTPGPYMSWDEYGVADPDVIRIGDWFYLYYLGQDRTRRQRLGVARSRDGINWEKLRTNPVLEQGGPGDFDEYGLGEPAAWQADGFYWMLYTGRSAGEVRKLGLARSLDGVRWTKLPGVFGGSQPWDSQVMCDPSVAGNRVYFGGGDIARPDENLHGQIGTAVLRPVPAAAGK